jgi:hypothetical protein
MKVVSGRWSVVSNSVFCFALNAMLLALSLPARAQQPTKIPKVGWRGIGSSSSVSRIRNSRAHSVRSVMWPDDPAGSADAGGQRD